MKEKGPKISLFGHADAHDFFPRWPHQCKEVRSLKFLCYSCGRERYRIEAKTEPTSQRTQIGYPINAGAWSNARMLFLRRLLIPGKKSQRIRSLLEPEYLIDRPDHATSLTECTF